MNLDIKSKLIDILEDLKGTLASLDIQEAKENIFHDEFGIALELVCVQIIENELVVTKKIFNKIRCAIYMLGMDKNLYRRLRVDS